ncbi:MAG TPA: ATP-binding protein [Methanoregula sp.]|nr:ATP-binding protein [Methanoregula sp.]
MSRSPHQELPESNTGKSAGSLRDRAEKRLRESAQKKGAEGRTEDLRALVHELQVHQVELEIQNDELIKAREEIEAGLERYTELFDFAPVGYFTLDRNGTILQMNFSGAALLGRERSFYAGRRFRDFVAPRSLPDFDRFLHQLGTGPDKTLVAEVSLIGERETTVQLRAHLSGKGGDCLLAVTDISGLRRTEQALQAANKKLSMLSSITRHDLNNQMLALRAYRQLDRKCGRNGESTNLAEKEDRIIRAIVQQIEFTKTYDEFGMKAPEWLDLRLMVEKAIRQVPGIEGITVTVNLPLVRIYADPLAEKVFYNLLDNSLRHGGHVTSIVISAAEEPAGLRIRYEDNGSGIPRDNKDRIFDRGFGEHTGFGMFLSREILAITGLSIRETGEPGTGARFEILVPPGSSRPADGTGNAR